DNFAHGNFRNWAAFTRTTQDVCQRTGRPVVNEAIARKTSPFTVAAPRRADGADHGRPRPARLGGVRYDPRQSRVFGSRTRGLTSNAGGTAVAAEASAAACPEGGRALARCQHAGTPVEAAGPSVRGPIRVIGAWWCRNTTG